MVTVTLNMHDYSCAGTNSELVHGKKAQEWGIKWISGSYDNYWVYFSWLGIGVYISVCYILLNKSKSSHVWSNTVILK